jgi:hypothetical protein
MSAAPEHFQQKKKLLGEHFHIPPLVSWTVVLAQPAREACELNHMRLQK